MAQMPANELVAADIPPDTLEHCLTYLSHHKDVEPDPLPCPVRSIHMAQIVSDPWDATWIDAFDKKTIFEIILAAGGKNTKSGAGGLDIQSLVHMACAKIATLIKQLDQTEINRIIEEEEQHRREQAQLQHGDDDEDEQLRYGDVDEDENRAEDEDWNEHGDDNEDENA